MPTLTIPPEGASIGLPLNRLNVLTNAGAGAITVDGVAVAAGGQVTLAYNQPTVAVLNAQGVTPCTVRIESIINREEGVTTASAWKKVPAGTSSSYRSTMVITNPALNTAALLIRSVAKGGAAPSSPASGSETYKIYPGDPLNLGPYGDATKDVYVLGEAGAVINYIVEELP